MKRPAHFPALGWALACLGLAGLAVPALAQSSTNVGDIISAANSPTDAASSFFRFILGNFWDSPLSAIAGGSTGLFGAMFAIYNAIIFVVGMFWASYGIGSAVADTAQTGEALGKRISLVWLPIRMVSGIAGIVPVFGGFSLSQVVLVIMATIGIGTANLMTNAAIDAASSFQTLMSPAAAVASSNKVDYRALALTIFRSNVCMLASLDLNSASAGSYAPLPGDLITFPMRTIEASGNSATNSTNETDYYYGSLNDPHACGGYRITYVNGADPTAAANGASSTSFRTGAVNYAAYGSSITGLTTAAQSSVMRSMTQLNSAVSAIARQWYQDRQRAADSTSVPLPIASINASADAARDLRVAVVANAVNSVLSEANSPTGAIPQQVADKMKAQGFAGVGAWYSAFSEASSAFTSALDSVSVTGVSLGSMFDNSPSVQDALRSVDKAAKEDGQADDDGDSALAKWMCNHLFSATATGNCSMGQSFVQYAIDKASTGTGGGSIVNPIVMFKNLGDDVLDMASTLTIAVGAAKLIPAPDDDGAVAKVVQKIPGIGIAASIASKIASLSWVIPYLVVLGLLMSIYVPMIPFVTWMGGVTQYVVIFCQGIVGMPIAAFAHLDAEGDGMGRRTEPGYMFILNVTFRPALMLFGFFMASGLMLVLGTFQASLFTTAMANAQGNSITGLYSVIGFLALFAVMNITLIQSLFNMIFLLPDQVLSLVGNAGHMADLGKDAEHKIHALFMSTGRTSQSALAELGRGKAKPPDSGRKAPSAGPGPGSKA